jgi:hypothetical protein
MSSELVPKRTYVAIENSALPQNSKTGKSIKKKHELITVRMAETA